MQTKMLLFAAAIASAVVLDVRSASALYISEFLALNNSTLRDEDGTYSDWLEIHNESATPVNVGGYYLTDNADEPTQWQFPSVSIPAGGYLLVWASNKDRTDPGLPLHTNFALGGTGEFLGLIAPDGTTIVHAYSPQFPEQFPDRAWGLASDLLTERCFFSPTPGEANDETLPCSLVQDVQFSVERGFFNAPFDVTLNTPTVGASIRYTLDGSEPTETNGTLYATPVAVATTSTLRAIAYLAGQVPTRSITHTYIFLDAVLQQSKQSQPPEYQYSDSDYDMDPRIVTDPVYGSTLIDDLLSIPSLSIVTDFDHLFGQQNGIYRHRTGEGVEWERPTSVELIRPDGAAGFQINCGIRMQGGVSRVSKIGKYSFRLLFKSIYGPSKLNYPLFAGSPVDSFDTITLGATFNDAWTAGVSKAQYLRDTWVKDSQRAMGQVASHNTFVHLYVNGRYWGMYRPTERPAAAFAASYFGGDKEEYDALNSGNPVDGDKVAWDTMQDLSKAGLGNPASYAALAQYLDVENLIDYMMVNIFAGNYDWPHHNWYAGRKREAGAGYKFFSWDAESSLTNASGSRVSVAYFDSPAALYDRLRDESEEFRVLFGDHVHRHFFNGGALTPEANIARWMERATEIHGALVAESARWGDRARVVPYTRDNEYLIEQRRLILSYFPARTRNVLEQFRGVDLYPDVEAPSFNQQGGEFFPGFELEMSAPDGIVYFTDDGSDPRLPGGGISPSAQVYVTPIALGGATAIRARARVGVEWSALNAADFASAAPLRITEVMYNPIGGTDFEFIELRNVGPAAIDLAGYALSGGLDFTFPALILGAGQHVLAVNNFAQFTTRYGGALPVAGVVSGNLSNGGEQIVLTDPDGGTVLDFEYDDGWYPLTDGPGRSLVIRDASGARELWSEAAGWRASAANDGNPGATEPTYCNNGVDDDGDLLIDLADPGCGDASQDFEDPACNDGIDNDGDGGIDLFDVHCNAASETSEDPGQGDSYLCYRTSPDVVAPTYSPVQTSLTDEFDSAVSFEARKPSSLCLAGSLDGVAPIEGEAHLRAYDIRETSGSSSHTPRTELRYEGGLAPLYLDTRRPERLLVPASTSLDGGGPLDPAQVIDHYKCYSTRTPTTKPRYFPNKAMVHFQDALESRSYTVKRPSRLCTPVSVDGSVIMTPGRHLLCYSAKVAKFSNKHVPVAGVESVDALFSDVVRTSREEEICVPSSLVVP
jgi:hypothetical protein